MQASNFLFELSDLDGFKDVEISSLHIDSRSLSPGGLFFALKGHKKDGIDFVDSALEKGAALVISDNKISTKSQNIIYFPDLREYLGLFASRFYGLPSTKLKVVCVTGTNGKTTSVETFSSMSNLLQSKCGYMSTINSSIDGHILKESVLTTEHPIQINSFLREALNNKVSYIAMEASSHGLEQNRLAGLEIDYAILTSFSHDHLDYHGSLKNYKNSKKKLFYDLKPNNNIICIDSEFGENLYQELKKINQNTYSVSIEKEADFYATFEKSKGGLNVNLKAFEENINFELSTISRYLASNIICSIAVLVLEGKTLREISSITKDIQLPKGRLERIFHEKNPIYIDYAHTPDALECALKEIRRSHEGLIWCLFGCGGDRDEQKRPLMGSVAEQYADVVVLTNDNPRKEDEKAIISDILSGIESSEDILIIPDRREAIEKILTEFKKSSNKDVLLIAGKGHESHQNIGNELLEFNDKDIVSEFLKTK
jgi:UDP-N-acetylmuramoyl-L-alanyl-D-glutamate--2,6-diaminopimelate ligase